MYRYWVVDPEKREIYVFAPRGGTFHLTQTVGTDPVEVDFGAGVALIDVAAIIPED